MNWNTSPSAIARAVELTGAKIPEFTARAETEAKLSEFPAVEADIHETVEALVVEHMADAGKLARALDNLARDHAEAEARAEVLRIAGLQATASLGEWIDTNADSIVAAISKALKPDLDRITAAAKILPEGIDADSAFPVNGSWTPEQHATWVETKPLLDKVAEVKALLSGLYAGLGGEHEIPGDIAGWIVWADPGAHTYLETLDPHKSIEHTFNMPTSTKRHVLLEAARQGWTLSLATPTEARARVATITANRTALRRAQEAHANANPDNPGIYIGRLLQQR